MSLYNINYFYHAVNIIQFFILLVKYWRKLGKKDTKIFINSDKKQSKIIRLNINLDLLTILLVSFDSLNTFRETLKKDSIQ